DLTDKPDDPFELLGYYGSQVIAAARAFRADTETYDTVFDTAERKRDGETGMPKFVVIPTSAMPLVAFLLYQGRPEHDCSHCEHGLVDAASIDYTASGHAQVAAKKPLKDYPIKASILVGDWSGDTPFGVPPKPKAKGRGTGTRAGGGSKPLPAIGTGVVMKYDDQVFVGKIVEHDSLPAILWTSDNLPDGASAGPWAKRSPAVNTIAQAIGVLKGNYASEEEAQETLHLSGTRYLFLESDQDKQA
ncbi:MAG: hypothetical protein KAJ19_10575, partial [Gammaproteobacteria bacterium]|nr:hypothetical protein [Gammaproteobacteria bacterium]